MIKEEKTSQPPQYDQERLFHWQRVYEQILHSNRAAVDIGLFVLKVVMVVNAGALIALLATIGQFKDVEGVVDSIAESAYPFFFGLMTAILGAGLSYFYQSLITANLWNAYYAKFSNPEEPPPFPWAGQLAEVVMWIVIILLVLTSCASFGFGAWLLISNIADLYLLP